MLFFIVYTYFPMKALVTSVQLASVNEAYAILLNNNLSASSAVLEAFTGRRSSSDFVIFFSF